MVPEKYGLAAIGRFLIEQFELRRPGIKEWTPEVERSLRRDAEQELLQMERQLTELGVDDPPYWQRVRGALDDILLPRYAASSPRSSPSPSASTASGAAATSSPAGSSR